MMTSEPIESGRCAARGLTLSGQLLKLHALSSYLGSLQFHPLQLVQQVLNLPGLNAHLIIHAGIGVIILPAFHLCEATAAVVHDP